MTLLNILRRRWVPFIHILQIGIHGCLIYLVVEISPIGQMENEFCKIFVASRIKLWKLSHAFQLSEVSYC
jgi:hypothetical protein